MINTIRRESGAHVNVNDELPANTPQKLQPAQLMHITGATHSLHHAIRLVGAHMRKTDPVIALSYNQQSLMAQSATISNSSAPVVAQGDEASGNPSE